LNFSCFDSLHIALHKQLFSDMVFTNTVLLVQEGDIMRKADNYKELLKSSGLKNTKRRNSILEILAHMDQPLTVDHIFLELKKKNVSINISTVYRILETLTAKDLVAKSQINGETRTLFELKRQEHKHHFICIDCKKMFWVDDCPFEEYCDLLQARTGFNITGHKLEIYGYCQRCR